MATDRLGDMRLFVEVAALGSLSAAGRRLGLSPAAASARLIKLEAALRTSLFERTTRRLRLTDEGRFYLHKCAVALAAIDEAEAALQAGQSEVRGKLRISAASDFGRHLLAGWLDEFSRLHPQVALALTLSDSIANLVQDEVDVAIRFALLSDSSMVARRLAPNWRVLCASPDYLARYGEPQTPAELAQHRFIVLVTAGGPLNTFHFRVNGQPWDYTVPMAQAWESNDSDQVRRWALAGHGIARKTVWDAAADIRAGRLKVVLPAFTVAEAGVYALLHGNHYRTPRVRVLLDFLLERFSQATEALLADIPPPDAPRSGQGAGQAGNGGLAARE